MPRPKPAFEEEIEDLLEWGSDARCQQYRPEMFDTRRRNQHTELSADNERAKEVCLACPVMLRCLEHAVRYRRTGAIWGSLSDEERDEWAAREMAVA